MHVMVCCCSNAQSYDWQDQLPQIGKTAAQHRAVELVGFKNVGFMFLKPKNLKTPIFRFLGFYFLSTFSLIKFYG